MLPEAGRFRSTLNGETMFRIITVEREYGCGGGAIAAQLAKQLGWKLWGKSRRFEKTALMSG